MRIGNIGGVMKGIVAFMVSVTFFLGTVSAQTTEYEVQGAKLGEKIARQVGESNFERTVTTNKVETWYGQARGDETGNRRLTSFVGPMDGAVMGSLAHSYKYQNYYHGERGLMVRKNLKNSTDISALEIANITYADEDGDGALGKYETAQVYFDLINTGDEPLYGITPIVMANKVKHVNISSPCPIDTLQAQHALRYIVEMAGDGKSDPGKILLVVRIRYGLDDYIDVQDILIGAKRSRKD